MSSKIKLRCPFCQEIVKKNKDMGNSPVCELQDDEWEPFDYVSQYVCPSCNESFYYNK